MISAWITYGRQTVDLGSLPADTYIMRAHVFTQEAWNSDGTDTLVVGSDADTDSIITSLDIASTGVKSPTLGSSAGYNSTAQQIKIRYVNSGSEPTTGKTLVILETTRTPPNP